VLGCEQAKANFPFDVLAMEIDSAQTFGIAVKRARTSQKLTQSELAFATGTGVRFIVDLERGKPTCQLGLALRVASMLGINLHAHYQGEEL
jgi:y4mF family transcriptional regulator